MAYESFKLIKKLYFERTSASKEELKAARILKKEAEKLGSCACLEEFEVDAYNINNAKLKFHNPSIEVECVGVGFSSFTDSKGITGDFIYITSYQDVLVSDVKDKICLYADNIISTPIYKELARKGAKGIILCSGILYDKKEDTDNSPYMYRERNYKHGKIPAVSIKIQDAEKILRIMPKSATIILEEDEFKAKSHNVVATIEGTKYKDEIICFSAHYDSVKFSKGAYDNATGSTTIMQILEYFINHRPDRTLKFIWCGSEECGLLGSINYTNVHKEELDNYKLNINVDMTGVTIGYDYACVSAGDDFYHYLEYFAKINGFRIVNRDGIKRISSSLYSS